MSIRFLAPIFDSMRTSRGFVVEQLVENFIILIKQFRANRKKTDNVLGHCFLFLSLSKRQNLSAREFILHQFKVNIKVNNKSVYIHFFVGNFKVFRSYSNLLVIT